MESIHTYGIVMSTVEAERDSTIIHLTAFAECLRYDLMLTKPHVWLLILFIQESEWNEKSQLIEFWGISVKLVF